MTTNLAQVPKTNSTLNDNIELKSNNLADDGDPIKQSGHYTCNQGEQSETPINIAPITCILDSNDGF